MRKELNELMYAAGLILGEVDESTKDGLGLEDLKSVKDLIDKRKELSAGFSGLGDMDVKGMDLSEMALALAELKRGFEEGKK